MSNLKILELEDALRKTTDLSMADNIMSRAKITVFKKHEAMIVDALEKCSTSCYLFFNADGILVSVKPDTYQVDYN